MEHSSDCSRQSSLLFLYRCYGKKIKLDQQSKPRPKCTGEIFTPNMFFPEFHWIHGPPNPPTNRQPTHRLLIQQLTESIIKFGRFDNGNILILQNTITAWKTYKDTRITFLKYSFFNGFEDVFVCWGTFISSNSIYTFRNFQGLWRSSFIVKELPLPLIVKAQNFKERNSGHNFADVCKIVLLTKKAPVPGSVFNEVAGLQLAALLQKRPQRRCFPVNSVEYLRTLFYRSDYFRLFKYIKVDKNISSYCNKDINMMSIEAKFVTLCQLWKSFCMLRKLWKPPSRKCYQNLRNLQGKYLWRSFVIIKPFFCDSQ